MPYKQVPTFIDNKWSYTNFETKLEWIEFMRERFMCPGKYRLQNTEKWQEKGLSFISNGLYTNLPKNSEGYNKFWKQEGVKCDRGIIFKGSDKWGEPITHYVTGYYYFYLNYCPITVKHEKNTKKFAEIWDLDYHTFLYLERSFIEGKFSACNKRRQTGWSYKMASIATCDMWFNTEQIIKVFSYGSSYVKAYWRFIADYKNHLLTHSGWVRQFSKEDDKEFDWHMMWKAQEGGKGIKIGRNNRIMGVNTLKTSERLVGGYNTLVISEESGIDPLLMQNIGYVEASLKQGEIVTGKFICGGSVGELKNCEGLREITYKPKDYGFLQVPDLENPLLDRVLFIPAQWNYIHPIYDPNDLTDTPVVIDQVKCYDKDGNSDIAFALRLIADTRLKKAKQSHAALTLYCSQNPTTLDELYQSRENSRFDIKLLSKQATWLQDNFEEVTIELEETDGKITHKLVHADIVRDFPVKKDSKREGAIVMVEPPIPNPKPYMYFAGVDPVKNIEGKGESLFSIHIYLNVYEENGTSKGGYPVAWYTGRHFNDNDTFDIGRKLIKYYNAMTTQESDIDSFLSYMKSFNEEHYLLKRSQIPIVKDLVPNSNISNDEYGVRMNTGGGYSRIRLHCENKIAEYITEVLDTYKDEFGNDTIRSGVERIKDKMLIKELCEYNKKLNMDRFTSFGLALMTAKCYESNRIIQRIHTDQTAKPKEFIMRNQFTGSKFNIKSNKLTLYGR